MEAITISSGRSDGSKTIDVPFAPSAVIATPKGGRGDFSRATADYNGSTVTLYLWAESAQSQSITRDVFWVAYK